MNSFVKGKNVYVPASDAEVKYERYLLKNNRGANAIKNTLETILGTKLDDYSSMLTGVNTRIEKLYEAGHDNFLFQERRYPTKLKALLLAVKETEMESVQLNEWITIDDIHNALEGFKEETKMTWTAQIIEQKYSDKQTLSKSLSQDTQTTRVKSM